MKKIGNQHNHVIAALINVILALAFMTLACSGQQGTATAPIVSATPTITTFPTASPSPTPTEGGVITTCSPLETVAVGPYLIEANFWNWVACPGIQCMAIDRGTGAFTVTQYPDCGNPFSFPNVLYGCSWDICSPDSTLPKQVGALTSATSSWSFSVGGTASDQWNVAYDIWFCPDDSCGSNGFPGGTELMIWLDYQNVNGWLYNQGPVSLAGLNWELWTATQTSAAGDWTYLAYLIQGTIITSVSNLDLMAFISDARARGHIQDSWYLYAVQAGIELRIGGIPYNHYDFSVSIP
ncbi:MAG: hypothetical protein JXR32_04360 [Anaerolineaceae bacterium]|nr:hypothetical protein [Anaerolineaceae bacterium]